jgi:hypothetical protein
VSFRNIRAPGAFLVSAARGESGKVFGVTILSEVGGVCKLAAGPKKPAVRAVAGGAAVAVVCDAGHYCSFKTTAKAAYEVTV